MLRIPSGCCSNKCTNKECSFVYKLPKENLPESQSHDFRPDLNEIELEVDKKFQKVVQRIKKDYLQKVPVDTLHATFLQYTTPCEILDHYSFATNTSADYLHCLPAKVLQAVLHHSHGLSPEFARMHDGQKTRAVWFYEATQLENKRGIKHCHDNHPDKFQDDKTVYGIIDPSAHAAVRAIVSAKGSTPMFYSVIDIPTNGLKYIKLN